MNIVNNRSPEKIKFQREVDANEIERLDSKESLESSGDAINILNEIDNTFPNESSR